MKVKTFTGTHRFAVDSQVNNWLAKSNVTVRDTKVAIKGLRSRGWDAVAGKVTDRRAVAIRDHGLVRGEVYSSAAS